MVRRRFRPPLLLRPNCLSGFAGDSPSLSPRRTVLSKISKPSSATPIFAARSLSFSLSLFGVVLEYEDSLSTLLFSAVVVVVVFFFI